MIASPRITFQDGNYCFSRLYINGVGGIAFSLYLTHKISEIKFST